MVSSPLSLIPMLALPLFLFTARWTAPVAIVGTWRGSSICVDQATDRFCRSEEVIYDVRPVGSAPDTVSLSGDKLVDGARVHMYDFQLVFDSAAGAWWFEFTAPRFHGRWSYRLADSTLTGTLVELPSQRLVRRVLARRSGAQ